MAKSIRNIRYGGLNPSKILFGDGTECKRVYVGGVMTWNKDDFAFSITPSSIDAPSSQKTYAISIISTNNEGSTQVPFTAISDASWIKPLYDGINIIVEADNEPRVGATEELEVYGDAYITNAGGTVELPEISCVWTNQIPRLGKVTYKQGDGSELEAVLNISQKCGSGEGTYTIKSKSPWLHVGANNTIIADKLNDPTSERYGEIVITSDLTSKTETFIVHQSNTLVQKREFGIFTQLTDNKLIIPCADTEGDSMIVIRYRYYQVIEGTNERIVGSETAWVDTTLKSWTVTGNTNFSGTSNSSIVTCTSNIHIASNKRGTLYYTLRPLDSQIPENEISSFKTLEIYALQEADSFINNGEIFYEYQIVSGEVPSINANGDAVQAKINSQYRRYKTWASDNTKSFFEGEEWLRDITATFVSQYVDGYAFNYNGLKISAQPNTSSSDVREGVGIFISNRIVNGQSLYIELPITQQFREQTEEYRFVNPELTINGNPNASWNPNAAAQSKTFSIISKVTREYKWTDGKWYASGAAEDWDYSITSVDWCNASVDLTARTATLEVSSNSDSSSRQITLLISQKSDSHFEKPLNASISVTQKVAEPEVPIVPPSSEPFVPDPTNGTRLINCRISIEPSMYSFSAAKGSKNDFVVNSTALVQYRYTDGTWRTQGGTYKIGYLVDGVSEDWCEATAQEISGKATVSVLSVNNTLDARNATITFKQKYSNWDSINPETTNLLISQKTPEATSEIKWENKKITAVIDKTTFGSEGTEGTPFTVVSTADKYVKYTNGEWYKVASNINLPYDSEPTNGAIRTDGTNLLIVEPFTGEQRSQDIVFNQKDENNMYTGATVTKTIEQIGDSPVYPEEFRYTNYQLTLNKDIWEIDAAEHTSEDNEFTYISVATKEQKWTSGWKVVGQEDIDVIIDSSSSTGDIIVKSIANGKITLEANVNHTFNNRTKTLGLRQSEGQSVSISVIQKGAEIVTPEEVRFVEDTLVLSIDPNSLTWNQTEIEGKTVEVTSYGYKVYRYTDNVWRGKTNKTTEGDKVDFNSVEISTSSHWNVENNGLVYTFTPKGVATETHTETFTFTQSIKDYTPSVPKKVELSLQHTKAQKILPEEVMYDDYTIKFENPTSPLNVESCVTTETPYSIVSKRNKYCLYDDGKYYFESEETFNDIVVTPSQPQQANKHVFVYDGKIVTCNKYSTTLYSQDITARQNIGQGKEATLTVNVPADSKSEVKTEYRISDISVDKISYQGTATNAAIVRSQKQTYKVWNSDQTRVEESGWLNDTTAKVASATYVSGDKAITAKITNGVLTFSASENTGESERSATFKVTDSNGAIKNVTVSQTPNIFTEYRVTVNVTPSADYTFANDTVTFNKVTNGTIRFTVSCEYRKASGDSGEWKSCEYTINTSNAALLADKTGVIVSSNERNESAITGYFQINPVDMSSTTGVPGTIPSTQISFNGYADSKLSGKEYKLLNASINKQLNVKGDAVTATVECKQRDYKYWSSNPMSHIELSELYDYTPEADKIVSETSSTIFKGNGLQISASSNEGTKTQSTQHSLQVVEGQTVEVSYENDVTKTLKLLLQKRVGEGRNTTSERTATFTFKVTFPDGDTQEITNINATQKGDEGQAVVYPTQWTPDNVNKATISHSKGSQYVTVNEPTYDGNYWNYIINIPNNKGQAATSNEYRVTYEMSELHISASGEEEEFMLNFEKSMPVPGATLPTDSRTEKLKIVYFEQEDEATYTQGGDPGDSDIDWIPDSEATITGLIVNKSSDFYCTQGPERTVVSVRATSNLAEPSHKREENYQRTTYDSHSITILSTPSEEKVSYEGGTSYHKVNATRNEHDEYEVVETTTYTNTKDRIGELEVTTSRGTVFTIQLRQDGETKADDVVYSSLTIDRTDVAYTPRLAWSSGYPSGSTVNTEWSQFNVDGTPYIYFDRANNKEEVTDGYQRNASIDKRNFTFDAQGETFETQIHCTKQKIYHYNEGPTILGEGKCYDIDHPTVVSNLFTAIQNGEPGTDTIIDPTQLDDTENIPSLKNLPPEWLHVDIEPLTQGYYSIEITADSNINVLPTVYEYKIELNPTEYTINKGETITFVTPTTSTITLTQRDVEAWDISTRRGKTVSIQFSHLSDIGTISIAQEGKNAGFNPSDTFYVSPNQTDYNITCDDTNIAAPVDLLHNIQGRGKGTTNFTVNHNQLSYNGQRATATGSVTVELVGEIWYENHGLHGNGDALIANEKDMSVTINRTATVSGTVLTITQ